MRTGTGPPPAGHCTDPFPDPLFRVDQHDLTERCRETCLRVFGVPFPGLTDPRPMRPGPQPCNQIAPTAKEQLARVFAELDARDRQRRVAAAARPGADAPVTRRQYRRSRHRQERDIRAAFDALARRIHQLEAGRPGVR